MSFVRKRGKTKFMWLPMTTSVAIGAGHLVSFSSGRLIEATSTTAPELIVGVIRHAITSASAEYSTASDVEVEVPVEQNVEWEADGTSFSTSTVGTYLDITDGDHVNGAAGTYDVFFHTKYISTTKGIGILNIGPTARAKA